MNIALLFDEFRPGSGYVPALARRVILRPKLLQGCGRLLTVRTGSVLLHSSSDPVGSAERLFFPTDGFRLGDVGRIRDAYLNSGIYSLVIANLDRSTAVALHESLKPEPAYLGLQNVDLGDRLHVAVYMRFLLRFRIRGEACWVFFREFDPESRDEELFHDLESLGFNQLEWEDVGLRQTFVDDFDSFQHFRRLASVRDHVSLNLPGGQADADELLLMLEDLDPHLAATLGVAAETFAAANDTEHLSQASLSGRRYLEQLADAVFPARSEWWTVGA